jgi:hypothetical protein
MIVLVLLVSSLWPHLASQAQSEQAYENPDLGLGLSLPADWEVRPSADGILAGHPQALSALDAGNTPDSLVLRILFGSFVDMNIPNASALPEQLTRLVPFGISAPAPSETQFGSLTGWEIEYSISDSNLTTRVGVVALPNGRLALLRAVASSTIWPEALGQYEAIKPTLTFGTPTNLSDPFADLPDGDGGVLWHYQAPQPADVQPVTLGGMAFDPFLLIYVAAGQRGILVLDQTNGTFINYLGPLFDDDNIADVAIAQDARLYVANATPGDNNQVMIVNRTGTFEYGFGSTGDAPGQFAPGMPRSIAVTRGREPKIWVVSEGHSTAPTKRLYQFDRFGNLLLTVDLDQINPDLQNIRLDNNLATGALYLIGQGGGGLNVLNAEGAALVTNLGLEVFAQYPPLDVAIAPSGDMIVATGSVGYLEFAPSGLLLDRFGIPYPADGPMEFAPGQMLAPAGTVIDNEGIAYFAETNPKTGQSQVQAFRFDGDGLLVLPSDAAPAEEMTHNTLLLDPAAGGGDLTYGVAVQGSLNNTHPSHDWFFEGQAGDRLRITLRDISPNGTLDTQLVLVDPNQIEVAEVDDVGNPAPTGLKETDSVIETELQTFGFYTVRATRFGGRGDYELLVEVISQ